MDYFQINFLLVVVYAVLVFAIGKQLRLNTRQIDGTFAMIVAIQLFVVYTWVDTWSIPDHGNYEAYFDNVAYYSWKELLTQYDIVNNASIEIGYLALMKLVSVFGGGYRWLLAIVYATLIACYWHTFKKYSPYVVISILLFFLTNFSQSRYVVRQHLAVAICLLAYPYIIDRKLLPFLAVNMIAFLIHRVSILFFPVYFLYGFVNQKNILWVSIIILFISVSSYFVISNYLSVLTNRYSMENRRQTILPVFSNGMILASYLYLMGTDAIKDGINKLISILLILTVIFCIASGNGGRAALFYSTAGLIAIPLAIKKCQDKNLGIIYGGAVLLSYFVITFFVEYQYPEWTFIFM
ncbi:MAG: EpsG family protein [Bacteroidales bacterium]|nr:EpsG family protein [Bacteroidales bacterium]